jgi:hypothetical protein
MLAEALASGILHDLKGHVLLFFAIPLVLPAFAVVTNVKCL